MRRIAIAGEILRTGMSGIMLGLIDETDRPTILPDGTRIVLTGLSDGYRQTNQLGEDTHFDGVIDDGWIRFVNVEKRVRLMSLLDGAEVLVIAVPAQPVAIQSRAVGATAPAEFALAA